MREKIDRADRRDLLPEFSRDVASDIRKTYSGIHEAEEKIDRANPNQHLSPFLHHDVVLAEKSRAPGYFPLETVLCAAYAQAAAGKGKERHAAGDDFNDQPILSIGRLLKSADGEAYQAIKKLREGLMMHRRGESEAALREMLGAINYIAATALLVAEEAYARDVADFERMQQEQADGASCDDADPL